MANISSGGINAVGSCDVVPPLTKKIQSMSHKRGGRKKTLSLNPEEREALENLIEEVILDGGMGESESGSSDEENKVSEDQKSYSSASEQTLKNTKVLASIKMPKKYYPGQLKVALKHMTDLPPRFSRKLKKAEKYLELNAATAASKKIISHASIKEEDEEEVASINVGNILNFQKNDLQNVSPGRSPRDLLNVRSKCSKDNQMKDLKKTIRTLLTDLDQYVDENDRTSLSLDLPGAVNCSDIEKDCMKRPSGSQSSEDSKSQAGIHDSMSYRNNARRNPYTDSPYNNSPNSVQGNTRNSSNNNFMNDNNQQQPARNLKSSPSSTMHSLPTSQHFTELPQQPSNILPANMDVPGYYFMPVPPPSPYYQSLPPQNYSIPPPSFLQYPPPTFPMQDNFISYPPSYSPPDYPYQPLPNTNMNQYGQLGMQLASNYKVLPISDPSKVNPHVYQTIPPSHQPLIAPNSTFPSNTSLHNHFNLPINTQGTPMRTTTHSSKDTQPPQTTHSSPSTIPTSSQDRSLDLSHERRNNTPKTLSTSQSLNASEGFNTDKVVNKSNVDIVSLSGDCYDDEVNDLETGVRSVSIDSCINLTNKNNNVKLTDHNNNEWVNDMRMEKKEGDEEKDDDGDDDGFSILLSQSFVKKLVRKFCLEEDGIDLIEVQETRVKLDDEILRKLYKEVLLRNSR